MQYIGRIFRPPSEARSLIIQVTVGCSHNKCTFCSMDKEKTFSMRPVEDVLADLSEMRERYRYVRRIFLADGDALICPAQRLLTILQFIRTTFPECERVASYGSPKSILTKTTEELKTLKEAGLGIVYLGLESGDDEILRHVCKGETAEEIVRAGQMVKEAGMILSVTAINGLGGTKRSKEHAKATGEALSRMKPDYIGLLSLMVEEGTPLEQEVRSGAFEVPDAKGISEEIYEMVASIDSEGTVFRANHASNYLSLGGTLNRDREEILTQLKEAIERGDEYKPEGWRLL